MARRWTWHDMEFLRNNYANMSNKKLANKLRRSEDAIFLRANRHDFKKSKEYRSMLTYKNIERQKEKKTGFFNSELQSKLGKKGAEKCKKLKVGAFFDKEVQSKLGKKGNKVIMKQGLTCYYNKKWKQDTIKKTHKKYPELASYSGAMSYKSQNKRPNKIEKKIIGLKIPSIKYVGNGSFWVRFDNGKMKNPDFVVRPFHLSHKVIEVNGNFWHKEPKGSLVKNYNEIGYGCLEIWEDEMKNLDKVRYKIERFINAN